MWAHAVLIALLLTAATLARAASDTQTESLLDSLEHFEVVAVNSATHAMAGPSKRAHLFSTSSSSSDSDGGAPLLDTHAAEHELSFRSHDSDFRVRLVKNTELFAPGYTQTRQYWTESGERRRELEPAPLSLNSVEQCYYQGRVIGASGEQAGRAGINTCDNGFTGVILLQASEADAGEAFVIEPAHKHLNKAQLRAHVQSIRTARKAAHTMSSSGPEDNINMYALHVVYKLRHTRAYATASAGGSLCGVSGDESGTEQQRGPQQHPASFDGRTEHDVQFNAFKAHFGVIDEIMPESVVPASRAGKGKLAQKTRSGSATGGIAVGGSQKAATSQRYVELFVANDVKRYTALGQTTEARSADIVNQINTIYANTAFSPQLLQVVLIGQTTFFYNDPWNITTGGCSEAAAGEVCVATLLNAWNGWRSNPYNTAPNDGNDAGHLFSGYKFQGSVLGYAGVGSMCVISSSGGINQLTDSVDSFNAVIAAHEIGHNLGMNHDSYSNSCPASGFIMNAIVTRSSPPTAFSSCSLNYYSTWAASSGSCLDNVPTKRYGDAVCGNGYVEEGEQCDCGPYGPYTVNTVPANFCNSTRNPCCDALSCQFLPGAVCSNTDGCCNDCQVAKATDNKVCRPTAGPCDLPETCDGSSSACPADDGLGNGASCQISSLSNPFGVCYDGSCTSYAKQCDAIGSIFSGGPYTVCERQNTEGNCGDLLCVAAGSTGCSYFTVNTADAQQMADGTPCGALSNGVRGNDRVCLGKQCVAVANTNSRYQWAATEWTKCNDCGSLQNRTVTCVRVSSGAVSDEQYCSASGRPASWQSCNDEAMLCDSSSGSSLSFKLFSTTVTVNSNVVIGVSLGVFFFLLGVLYLCVACVRKRATDQTLALDIKDQVPGEQQLQQ